MTWYAHHIYAEPMPNVIDALGQAWPHGLFHVPRLDDALDRRRLPANGFVVVRELCDLGGGEAEWFGDAAVSWDAALSNAGPIAIAPEDVSALLELDLPPPVRLLGGLRAISRATESVVSLICTGTSGGTLEYAFAWVFDGAWDRDHVYIRREPARGPANEAVVRAWSSSHANRPRTVVGGDVLTLVLTHHGLLLADGIFPLFRRDFPWERYRLAPTPYRG